MALHRRRLKRFFTPSFFLLTIGALLVALQFWPRAAAWENAVLHSVFHPVLAAFSSVSTAAQKGWDRLWELKDLSGENVRLKQEVASLREKVMEMEPGQAEAARLRELLGLKERQGGDSVGAKILAYDPIPGSRSVWIDQGSESGVARGQAVVSLEGVVGVIAKANPQDASVLLMTDPRSAVAGEVTTNGARGLVRGKEKSLGFDRRFWLGRMEYLDHQSGLSALDEVVTSGLDQVFPPGLKIGQVRSVTKDETGFLSAEIIPAVDFSRLREVIVLKSP